MDARVPARSLTPPRLRGRIHQASVPFAIAAGTVLCALRPPGERRTGSLVYAIALTALFAISASYHRCRQRRTKAVLRRADHCMILVFIAGTFTPLAVVATAGAERTLLLSLMWGAALVGVAVRMGWHHAPAPATALVYAVVGLSAASVLPSVYRHVGVVVFLLIITGGVVYLAGAMVYARGRPDPRPAVFGFHEVFHALTVLAATLQYTGLSLAVLGAR